MSELFEYRRKVLKLSSRMPSVSHISLAGLIGTGTHGTGVGYGILASDVSQPVNFFCILLHSLLFAEQMFERT